MANTSSTSAPSLPAFHDTALLRRALTHASYTNEHPDQPHNERLEFLGDAVLDFVAAEWLYAHFPDLSEGRLTTLRAALVRAETLAEFAQRLHLGEHLRLGRGEAESGGRQRVNILADAFEALLGALYLDQGLAAVRDLLAPLLAETAPAILAAQADRDPKTRLQEWSQREMGITPRYEVIAAETSGASRNFTVAVWLGNTLAATGSGPSKQQAQQAAARSALKALNVQS